MSRPLFLRVCLLLISIITLPSQPTHAQIQPTRQPAPAKSPQNYFWIEGESAIETNIKPHPWYSEAVKKNNLSGGKWLAHFDPTRDGAAQYTFNAAAGLYTFWIRANPVASKMSYRLNGSPTRDIDFSQATDRINVAADEKPDLRFLSWVRIGQVQLLDGKNNLLLKMSSDNNHHGAVDCFAFVDPALNWTPTGTLRPGDPTPTDRPANAPSSPTPLSPGLWLFNAPKDTYLPTALLDLSSLNEKQAGETGFIRRSSDGNDFVRGDGTPIRFWSVVSGATAMTDLDMEDHCRFLAKRGINMVRLHLTLCNFKEGAQLTDIDEKTLDRVFKFVSIARRHGIYLTLSPYWANLAAPKSWGIEDYDGQQPWGLLFFNPKLQAAYKSWIKEIYTRPNPYTGTPLKDEPALAVIQLQNEDSLLFWTFQNLKGKQKQLAGECFATWAANKYGTLPKALDAWNNTSTPDDNIQSNRLGFDPLWALIQAPPKNTGKRQRLADQTQFLAETMHQFNQSTDTYLRELGCKQLINAENWRSADPAKMDDAERWSYTANQIIATNVYLGGLHIGPNSGYRIDPGHYFTNRSRLKDPEGFAGSIKQVAGFPTLITECSWTDPNLYQSEGPLMMAAYQSLTGVDSTYFFSAGEPQFLNDPRRLFWPVGDSYALIKWSCSTPMTMAQFPAYALAFRKGYIKPADKPVVYEERSQTDLWERRPPIIAEAGKFDPNRDPGAFAPNSPIKQEVDRLAFLVGPVVVKYNGDPKNNHVEKLSDWINPTAGTVTSITRQITLNFKQGLLTVTTPKFQALSGFLKDAGGKFDLPDLHIESNNTYATLALISLDDLPLTTSQKILIQVGTTARPAGFTSKPATFKADNTIITGEEIVKTGGPGWQIENTDNSLEIHLPPDCLYIILE